MPLTPQFAASRYLSIIPNLERVGLLSKNAGETGYTSYAWTGRELPTVQDVGLSGSAIIGKRMKVVEVIKATQVVEPKEEDEVYVATGPVPGMWSRLTVKSLDIGFNRLVFHMSTLFSKSVTPITFTPTTLPNGTAGVAYSQALTGAGGNPLAGGTVYAWSISIGSLPAGLTINASTGLISGTPTTSGETETFTVTAQDDGKQVVSQSYVMVIN